MSTPFLGEIKMVSFNFPPKGWTFCNGQLLPINQNQALFSLMGTMYGGDGRVNFGLPDLRGRSPIHVGAGYTQGQRAGAEFHTIIQSEMPAHTHFASGTAATGRAQSPGSGAMFAASRGHYADAGDVTLHPSTVSNVGGSQPHENRSPYLVINFIVALQGIFPSQS